MKFRQIGEPETFAIRITDVMEKVYDSYYKEVVIFCIGTDRVVGDSLGPLVGTLLQEELPNAIIYGTLNKPIHALNLTKYIKEMNFYHPRALVIAIDACLGYTIGEMLVSNEPIQAGRGVGKTLPPVGDISVIGITSEILDEKTFTMKRDTRLSLVYNMAKDIVNSLIPAIEYLEKKMDKAIIEEMVAMGIDIK